MLRKALSNLHWTCNGKSLFLLLLLLSIAKQNGYFWAHFGPIVTCYCYINVTLWCLLLMDTTKDSFCRKMCAKLLQKVARSKQKFFFICIQHKATLKQTRSQKSVGHNYHYYYCCCYYDLSFKSVLNLRDVDSACKQEERKPDDVLCQRLMMQPSIAI